jgi:hypothetical protein
MDLNAGLIDQRVNSTVLRIKDELITQLGAQAGKDGHKLKSAAFTLLCIQALLSIDEESALDCLTDASQDVGIDALHIGDVVDGEFVVTLIQSKYSKSLDGANGYPANSIVRVISTVRSIFDPRADLHLHARLEELVTEVRSLILDGHIPDVRVLLCNNGKIWEKNGEHEIHASDLTSKRVSFYHINHEKLVELFQKRKSIDSHLKLSGKSFVDDFDYRRVLVGRLPVTQIKTLFDTHGDTLLDRNIRRYLGLKDNRVNIGIHETLINEARRGNFYFFNNGITAVCSKFSHNALQADNWEVHVRGLQIVNGGQTCKTIQRTLQEDSEADYSRTFVLLRLYELSAEDDHLVNSITFATNSQNPVDLTDLRSNDVVQERLAIGLRDLGFEYKKKRDDQAVSGPDVITSSVAAEAVMAVWKRRPNAAKFRRSKLFSDFYDDVFSLDLQASHVVLSVLAFRLVESERKRPKKERPRYVPYASHFLAMVVGDLLLQEAALTRDQVTHLNLPSLRSVFDRDKGKLYNKAVGRVGAALRRIGVKTDTPLPRIAAQFRRGDLLEPLQNALAQLSPPRKRHRSPKAKGESEGKQ